MKIALAAGYRAGKDHLAAKLVVCKNFTRLAFADIVKQTAADIYPWLAPDIYAANKTPEVRQVLNIIGSRLNKKQCSTTFIVAKQAAKLKRVVISDLRYKEELDYCLLNKYKIVYLGEDVSGYDLELIKESANLRLPYRPNISATDLLNKLF